VARDRKDTGDKGEELVAAHLQGKGYRIARRNYRCSLGEIDIIAEDGDEIVVIEVRTRRMPCLVRPEETITRAKAARLVRLAEHYLDSTGQEERPWRVDVVAVEMDSSDRPLRVEQYRDAVAEVLGRR
jgi:putative endonuclease